MLLGEKDEYNNNLLREQLVNYCKEIEEYEKELKNKKTYLKECLKPICIEEHILVTDTGDIVAALKIKAIDNKSKGKSYNVLF